MGHCFSSNKNTAITGDPDNPEDVVDELSIQVSPFPRTLPPGIAPSPIPSPSQSYRTQPPMSPAPSMLNWTLPPGPPLSPARPIMALIRQLRDDVFPGRRSGSGSGSGAGPELDKRFGFATEFWKKYEVVREVGKGHFGNTFVVRVKKGELKGQLVAAKFISKDKMKTAFAIEDVRREVKLLKFLSGHINTVMFHDALEDDNNVYIVMELCEGGDLLGRITAKGGRYNEEDARTTVIQILNGVAFFHLQGIVHRDLKPENFVLSKQDDDSSMKIIDFGFSNFVRTDQCLSEVVGTSYYVAPEVLHRSYGVEADIWSIGIITYILLSGSRPFWGSTESGIFRSVIRNDPNFEDPPWPIISAEATDFVRKLLNKDPRKRITAAQALTHPWLRDENRAVPLDIFIYKLVKSYIRATPFKRSALKALLKAIPEDELVYLKAQFSLLQPENGHVSLANFKMALLREATDAMKESGVLDILNMMAPLTYAMDFQDFCAASISIYQLEAHKDWVHIVTMAFQYFEEEGNKVISVQELTQEMNLGSMGYLLFKGWIRSKDGRLSLLGYTKLLHGVTLRTHSNQRR